MADQDHILEDDILEEYEVDENEIFEEELDRDERDESSEKEDYRDDSIAVFLSHEQAVLCCDLSNDDKFAVTGGQDDKAIIWDVATAGSKELLNFKDSVVAVKFNSTSKLLAIADMSGTIKVLESETWIEKFNFEINDIYWLLWHPIAENVLLCGTITGDAWMWKLSDKNEQCKLFPSEGFGNNVAKIFSDGKRIAMGYDNGSIRIFDLKDAKVLHSDSQAHSGTVVSLDLNSDDTLLATGSTDSTVKIINTTNFKPVFSIDCSPKEDDERQETTNSIESLLFCGKNLLAIGGLDGTFEIWDVGAKIKRSQKHFDSGIFKMLLDKNDSNQIFVGTLDEIFLLDIRDCNILSSKVFQTPHSELTDQFLDFAISSDSQFVISANENQRVAVFSFEKE